MQWEVMMKADEYQGWVTFTQAAEITGFSAPYMTALLESRDFAGKIEDSILGCVVRASDVRAWMVEHDVRYPLSKEDLALLAEPTPPEFFEEDELSPEEEARLQKQMELDHEESMKYRPTRPLKGGAKG
jgi:hypothetical protein